MPIRWVLLDFDGTCTQVDRVHAGFLERYRELLEVANGRQRGQLAAAWTKAHDDLFAASPEAGWTILDAPGTAPVAADPYILSGEITKLLLRRKEISVAPIDIYEKAVTAHQAPWRSEVKAVLSALVAMQVRVAFVSNTGTTTISNRLDDLLFDAANVRAMIEVIGNAAKYTIQEVLIEASSMPFAAKHKAVFDDLPGVEPVPSLHRPVYLRRVSYFDSICAALSKLSGTETFAAEQRKQTMVCGDIYELDLALPKALGMPIHLVTRAAPYKTYPYEIAAVPSDAYSSDLTGLVARIRALNS